MATVYVRVKIDKQYLFNGTFFIPGKDGYCEIPEELAIAEGIMPTPPKNAK